MRGFGRYSRLVLAAWSGAVSLLANCTPEGRDDAVLVAVEPTRVPGSPDEVGEGPCAGTTLRSVVEAIQESFPELAGIERFRADTPLPAAAASSGSDSTPSSYYSAALGPQGDWMIAFSRCEAEFVESICADEQFWFFTTDAQCRPALAPRVRQLFDGECFDVQGQALSPLQGMLASPEDRCDFDPMPGTVGGEARMIGVAAGHICGVQVPGLQNVELMVAVHQDGQDPGRATVTISGSGYACLDDRPLHGRVIRDNVQVDASLGRDGGDDDEHCALIRIGPGSHPPPFIGFIDYVRLDAGSCRFRPSYSSLGGIHLIPDAAR